MPRFSVYLKKKKHPLHFLLIVVIINYYIFVPLSSSRRAMINKLMCQTIATEFDFYFIALRLWPFTTLFNKCLRHDFSPTITFPPLPPPSLSLGIFIPFTFLLLSHISPPPKNSFSFFSPFLFFFMFFTFLSSSFSNCFFFV